MSDSYFVSRCAIQKTSAVLALFVSAVAACSGTSPSLTTCAVGTRIVGNECVALDAGVSWDAADDGPDASVSTDANAATEAAAASDAVARDSGSDPCDLKASEHMAVNCSPQCAAGPFACVDTTCGAFQTPLSVPPITMDGQGAPTFVLRTPERPGRDPACARLCGASAHASAMSVMLKQPTTTSQYLVRVDPPWKIYGVGNTDGICDAGSNGVQCWAIFRATQQIVIATDDPDAPARNVRIEASPSNPATYCPP